MLCSVFLIFKLCSPHPPPSSIFVNSTCVVILLPLVCIFFPLSPLVSVPASTSNADPRKLQSNPTAELPNQSKPTIQSQVSKKRKSQRPKQTSQPASYDMNHQRSRVFNAKRSISRKQEFEQKQDRTKPSRRT